MAAWKSGLASSHYDSPTQHAAVFLYGVAANLAYLEKCSEPRAVTGHSLGIYAAAVAAGTISPGSAVRLVLAAGAGIEQAQQATGMVLLAVTGLTAPELHKLIGRFGEPDEVAVTHYNTTIQQLVSGREATLREVAERCLQSGALSATVLPFPGAVHRPDLASFAGEFNALVDDLEFRAPTTRFYSPVSGELVRTADDARATIRDQLTRPVRFSETILAMASDGIRDFIVLGPCAQLMGIIGWIHREARVSLFPGKVGEVR